MSDGKNPPPERKPAALPATQALERVVKDAISDILGPAQQKQVVERLSPRIESLVVSVAKFHSGPLPPVDVVEGYERVVPGSFERILSMAERDQEAVIESQRYASEKEAGYRTIALAAGMLALVLILGAIIYLSLNGHPNVALGVCGLGAAGIITAFVNARWGGAATPKDDKKVVGGQKK